MYVTQYILIVWLQKEPPVFIQCIELYYSNCKIVFDYSMGWSSMHTFSCEYDVITIYSPWESIEPNICAITVRHCIQGIYRGELV